jgi:adenosylmethionine-8-amino-7-oxononanoate aminotransferase
MEAPGGIRVVTSAQGSQITDAEGNTFYDPMGGLELVNVGYGRTEIAEAVFKQLSEIHYTDPFRNQTVPQIRLATRLADLLPGSLSKVFFVSGGSEANEAALKIIWQYHELRGFPHKKKVIARRNSYHGTSLGAVTLVGPSSTSFAYSPAVEPLPSWGRQVPPPNPYRCDYCSEQSGCTLQCATEIERMIEFERADTVAAVVLDPISAQHGVPPPGYVPAVRDICERHNVLLWLDEVITGFGRTGKWFAAEHWAVKPDVMTVSKGITSGYMPLGAAVVTEEIAAEFKGGPERALKHGNTWGGHPAACAAGLVNLDIIERENLVENARDVGSYFLEGISSLKEHSIVGDVSGAGLMVVVDLVQDKSTRAPLVRGNPILRALMRKMREHGLLGSPYLLTPPLNLTRGEAEEIVTRLERAFAEVERELG